MIKNGSPLGVAPPITLPPRHSAGLPTASTSSTAHSAAGRDAQGEIAALPLAGNTPAVADHFSPGKPDRDRHYLALAGLLPALKVTMPPSKAEQQARDALESTLGVIDTMAASLLKQSTLVLKGGASTQQLALAAAIDRFLRQAEITMTGLVDAIVVKLPTPPSPAMQKLAALMSNGMWRDIEEMQKALEKTFETPIAGSQGNTKPDATQCQRFARHFAERNSQNFHAQLAAINLQAVRDPAFDARHLSGMAAMRLELTAVEQLARDATETRTTPPFDSAMAASVPVPGSSNNSAVADEHLWEDDDEVQEEEEENGQPDGLDLKPFSPDTPSPPSDQ